MPPIRPPRNGATQNSHSWLIAPAPANSATPVERAGFTEVLVTGMLIRLIRVSARPMAMPAKPAGARPWVAHMSTMRQNAVITTSHKEAASTEYPCGDSAAQQLLATAPAAFGSSG